MKELTIEALVDNLSRVLSFIDVELEALDCPTKTQLQLDIAVEELFVNIASYAYAPGKGSATIRFEAEQEPKAAVITLIDSGTPYNPLARKDPDVTLTAEQRQIGGLGIYMVKKSMDDVTYEYADGKNILSIKKLI